MWRKTGRAKKCTERVSWNFEEFAKTHAPYQKLCLEYRTGTTGPLKSLLIIIGIIADLAYRSKLSQEDKSRGVVTSRTFGANELFESERLELPTSCRLCDRLYFVELNRDSSEFWEFGKKSCILAVFADFFFEQRTNDSLLERSVFRTSLLSANSLLTESLCAIKRLSSKS